MGQTDDKPAADRVYLFYVFIGCRHKTIVNDEECIGSGVVDIRYLTYNTAVGGIDHTIAHKTVDIVAVIVVIIASQREHLAISELTGPVYAVYAVETQQHGMRGAPPALFDKERHEQPVNAQYYTIAHTKLRRVVGECQRQLTFHAVGLAHAPYATDIALANH